MKWPDVNLLGRNFANNILKLLRSFTRCLQNILLLTSSLYFFFYIRSLYNKKKACMKPLLSGKIFP